MKIYEKDPDDKLDYSINWETWLAGDTITSSMWLVDAGLTNLSNSHADTRTTIWLSGGTLGELYTVTNRITTALGRIVDRTFYINVKEQ